MIEIYVDGACSNNGAEENFGGIGMVVTKDSSILVYTLKKGYSNTTNNEMELTALLYGIRFAKLVISKQKLPIVIYSDSAYCINIVNSWMSSWAANNWVKKSNNKPPENLELIKKIYNLLEFERAIKVKKIQGHGDNKFNAAADELAVKAREEEQLQYLNSLKAAEGRSNE